MPRRRPSGNRDNGNSGDGDDGVVGKPVADCGAWFAARQMGAMLWKNALLKKAEWKQTTAEVRVQVQYVRA